MRFIAKLLIIAAISLTSSLTQVSGTELSSEKLIQIRAACKKLFPDLIDLIDRARCVNSRIDDELAELPKAVTIKRQMEYDGIKIGSSREEVLYIKGRPTSLWAWCTEYDGKPKASCVFAPFFDKETLILGKLHDFKGNFQYRGTFIRFSQLDNRVSGVWCEKVPNQAVACPGLLGIYIGSKEEDIYSSLGEPNEQKIDSGLKKIYYEHLNVYFYLSSLSVFRMGIGVYGKDYQ